MREAELGVWPTLPPSIYLKRPAPSLPWPLEAPGGYLFARARHALAWGLQALGLGEGDAVLAPAYHHGSEIEALQRGGLELRYYDATRDLEPDPDELEGLLDPTVKALHLIHTLGFPRASARWREWCATRGLLLLEDAAQAWTARHPDGRPVGRDADLAIFCMYKTYGIPDGAALFLRSNVRREERSSGPGGGARVVKRQLAWLMQRSAVASALGGRLRKQVTYSPASDFELGQPDSMPARASLSALRRAVGSDAADGRRRNYGWLADRLARAIPAPFDRLEGAAPFAFPIEVADKARMLDHLRSRGIHGISFWAVPHPSLPVDRFPGAADRRARTIALPVHQELRRKDLERIAAATLDGLTALLSTADPDAYPEIV